MMKLKDPLSQLKICDCLEARKIASEYDFVVSIADPGSPHCYSGKVHTSYNTFHDIGKQFAEGYGSDFYIIPQFGHISAIKYQLELMYFGYHKDSDLYREEIDKINTILVHCAAGISRSTAIGLLILLLDGYSIEESIKILFKIRPVARPNPLIVSIIDDMLILNGKLKQAVSDEENRQIMKNSKHILGPDGQPIVWK